MLCSLRYKVLMISYLQYTTVSYYCTLDKFDRSLPLTSTTLARFASRCPSISLCTCPDPAHGSRLACCDCDLEDDDDDEDEDVDVNDDDDDKRLLRSSLFSRPRPRVLRLSPVMPLSSGPNSKYPRLQLWRRNLAIQSQPSGIQHASTIS